MAFGVLPVCIGIALYKRDIFDAAHGMKASILSYVPFAVIIALSAAFVLCALIRLAYFNITVEETQSDALGDKKHYFGLPVTSTALIFPTFLLIRWICKVNFSYIYYILLIIVAVLFILKFKLRKPGSKWIYIMVAIGALEFIAVWIMKLKK